MLALAPPAHLIAATRQARAASWATAGSGGAGTNAGAATPGGVWTFGASITNPLGEGGSNHEYETHANRKPRVQLLI